MAKPMHFTATLLAIHLLFVGDLMHHNAQDRLARVDRDGLKAGYFDRWALVAPAISAADLAVGNLETAVNGGPVSGFPTFNAPVEFVQAAAQAGFDVLGFANNHSMDGNYKGFDKTMNNVQAAGMRAMGDGTPLYMDVKGKKIGILAFTSTMNVGSKFRVPEGRRGPYFVHHDDQAGRAGLAAKVAEMRRRADVVVVFVHWGGEYLHRPASWSRPWSRELAAAGADVIVGHHPHVVGPTEWIQGPDGRRTFVAYSLGNFSSGMIRDSTPYGYMLDVVVAADGSISPTIRPVWTYRDGADGQWRTYRTVLAADLEADCAARAACPARAACLDRPTMPRTRAAPHECRRYRDAIKEFR